MRMKQTTVGGVTYPSLKLAAAAAGLSASTLRNRLKNPAKPRGFTANGRFFSSYRAASRELAIPISQVYRMYRPGYKPLKGKPRRVYPFAGLQPGESVLVEGVPPSTLRSATLAFRNKTGVILVYHFISYKGRKCARVTRVTP